MEDKKEGWQKEFSALRHIVVMAMSLLRSGVGKAKAAKNHVDESLEKVRAKSWASPLVMVLEVSSKVVSAVEGFVPTSRLGICQKIYTTQFLGKRILHTENA